MTTRKITDERWINLFEREHADKNGEIKKWNFASRTQEPADSIAKKQPDAVIIAAIVDNPDEPYRHVCTAEYRVAIGGFEFGFPAGLVDKGETAFQAAKRELYEETGLIFKANKLSPIRLVSSAGLSDECVQIVFGTARGKVGTENQEASENIQTHLLTQSQCKVLVNQDNPLNCIGWSDKAWPILAAFSQGALLDYYGLKK
jgi:ADP-ribose pyrophosphatase